MRLEHSHIEAIAAFKEHLDRHSHTVASIRHKDRREQVSGVRREAARILNEAFSIRETARMLDRSPSATHQMVKQAQEEHQERERYRIQGGTRYRTPSATYCANGTPSDLGMTQITEHPVPLSVPPPP